MIFRVEITETVVRSAVYMVAARDEEEAHEFAKEGWSSFNVIETESDDHETVTHDVDNVSEIDYADAMEAIENFESEPERTRQIFLAEANHHEEPTTCD